MGLTPFLFGDGPSQVRSCGPFSCIEVLFSLPSRGSPFLPSSHSKDFSTRRGRSLLPHRPGLLFLLTLPPPKDRPAVLTFPCCDIINLFLRSPLRGPPHSIDPLPRWTTPLYSPGTFGHLQSYSGAIFFVRPFPFWTTAHPHVFSYDFSLIRRVGLFSSDFPLLDGIYLEGIRDGRFSPFVMDGRGFLPDFAAVGFSPPPLDPTSICLSHFPTHVR